MAVELKEKPECLTPYSESRYAVEGDFRILFWFIWKDVSLQFKPVDLSDRLHPVMKPFHPAGSGFFSRMASLFFFLS